MTERARGRSKQVDEQRLMQALAAIVANTRRIDRKLNLLQIAEEIALATEALGSVEAVAERLPICKEMLRQFASTNRLAPSVKRLIVERKLDSIDVARYLTTLSPSEQIAVARTFVRGDIVSKDVRATVALRKSFPDIPIDEAVSRVKESRNIKQYRIEFLMPPRAASKEIVLRRFERLLGKGSIRSFNVEGRVATVTISSDGKKALERVARERQTTKRKLVDSLLAPKGR